jgi:hypothetical protein
LLGGSGLQRQEGQQAGRSQADDMGKQGFDDSLRNTLRQATVPIVLGLLVDCNPKISTLQASYLIINQTSSHMTLRTAASTSSAS